MKGTLSTLVVLLSATVMFAQQYDDNSPPPAFPPSNVDRVMDRDQMVWQLGIRSFNLPPKLEDPNAPYDSYPRDMNNPEGDWTDSKPWGNNTITRTAWGLWSNYDDITSGFYPGPDSAKVGNYTPIDLLKMHNGTIISTADQWWNERRPELFDDIQKEMWGVIPPRSEWPAITWTVTTTAGVRNGVNYIQKAIKGTIDISGYSGIKHAPKITATLRVPADAESCVPVMIVFNWPLFGSSLNTYWDYVQPKGWGACEFAVNDLQPDFVIEFFPTFAIKTGGDYLTDYIIGLINKGNWRKPSDWGTLAAWSWGVSRLIDYFETDLDVDATQIGITGHSRFGKAALVAMAYEPRLAIAFASESGSLGLR